MYKLWDHLGRGNLQQHKQAHNSAIHQPSGGQTFRSTWFAVVTSSHDVRSAPNKGAVDRRNVRGAFKKRVSVSCQQAKRPPTRRLYGTSPLSSLRYRPFQLIIYPTLHQSSLVPLETVCYIISIFALRLSVFPHVSLSLSKTSPL